MISYNSVVDWKRVENFIFKGLDPVKGHGRFHQFKERSKAILRRTMREYVRTDLRWSYLAIMGMVAVGALVNLAMPHGWTVWPFVMAAGIMMLMHEAAERNLSGVPPFHVYVFFFSAMACWFTCVIILSVINPVILLIGILVMSYYLALGYLKKFERKRVITKRRMEGRCIFCGAIADYDMAYCANCGREPDPDDAQLKRVAYAPRSGNIKEKARAALKQASPTAGAKQKEQALMARRRTGQSRRR